MGNQIACCSDSFVEKSNEIVSGVDPAKTECPKRKWADDKTLNTEAETMHTETTKATPEKIETQENKTNFDLIEKEAENQTDVSSVKDPVKEMLLIIRVQSMIRGFIQRRKYRVKKDDFGASRHKYF